MFRPRHLRLGAAPMVAAALLACSGQVVTEETDSEQDLVAIARASCEWQRRCVEEFDQEYHSVEHCVALELYRHAEPSSCARANASFRECLVGLTCEEYRTAKPQLEALQDQQDHSVPDGVPCLIDLFFYNDICADWECDNGQVIARHQVCNQAQHCTDNSDETGCP